MNHSTALRIQQEEIRYYLRLPEELAAASHRLQIAITINNNGGDPTYMMSEVDDMLKAAKLRFKQYELPEYSPPTLKERRAPKRR